MVFFMPSSLWMPDVCVVVFVFVAAGGAAALATAVAVATTIPLHRSGSTVRSGR